MEGNHEIGYCEQTVGKAEVSAQGLYYRISCRCQISDGEVCRLVAYWQDGWVSLGIMIPEGDGLCLHKKIPQKNIPAKEIRFLLIPAKQDPEAVLFPPKQVVSDEEASPVGTQVEQQNVDSVTDVPDEVPLREDVPFDDLDRLEDGKLEMRDGDPYVIFSREEAPSEVHDEADRAMIGAQDIRVDGSGADLVTDPV